MGVKFIQYFKHQILTEKTGYLSLVYLAFIYQNFKCAFLLIINFIVKGRGMINEAKYISYLIIVFPIALVHLLMAFCIVFVIRTLPLNISIVNSIFLNMKYYVFHLGYSLLKFWFPRKFTVVYMKSASNSKPHHFITISNHVSDFDWMFVSYVIEQLGYFDNLTITMKDSIRKAPIIGYLLDAFGSIFLARNGKPGENGAVNGDLEKLQKWCENSMSEGGILNPLLFPEGTYVCSETLQASQEYYEKVKDANDQFKYFQPNFVLMPRTGGFRQLLLCLPTSSKILRNFTLFTTPYENFVFDNYSNKDLFTGSKSYHLNVLIQDERIPDSLLGLIRKIRKLDKDSAAYNAIIKEFKVKSTGFLNTLFKKKAEIIKAYSEADKHREHSMDGKDFYKFCMDNVKSEETFKSPKMIEMAINSPFRTLYFSSAVLLFIAILGAVLGMLFHWHIPKQIDLFRSYEELSAPISVPIPVAHPA